ncbi:YjbE family integral membrane protein [Cerasibacillus quisquiliarum]|uniref:Putative membrane protein YjbE n=2 Tax=Cerasibacillus quisquiliarum TaxID=227865 RepID=A0A511UXL2_9BACI|nr:YjbE family integral membrane protein [Cerasibacillus quisquiliarum]GEN31370.1 putative membrane protein YjbE [Cerasibacillus quisquiliarum]
MLGIEFTTESMIALLTIIAIDIVLSGDNAIVIAMATRKLPKKQQNKAILFGTAGAVFLRILFAAIIVYLLKLPYVHLIGGLLLLWIAYQLLVEKEDTSPTTTIQASNSLFRAFMTIIMADIVMSLDNVVAVAGAAKGHVGLIVIGVMISIPIMIFGSKLIVRVMDKYPWISYVGAGILAWTAGEMITQDSLIINLFSLDRTLEIYGVIVFITIAVLGLGYVKNRKSEA